ncbi:MAG TPA: DUF1611 domain-containing protein [Bdellovibrionales bacterium]|nr:MAG: hypothetical protein A2X97_15895 [Bdellovibrionales bacterium GWA1_52_35]HAR43517.1 DUF1611 domain-containing protein [Bdellovibrionales bacterium]HCM39684.1 DUF1611 domain-containing protein [Bdellovibrionales bacterium]
MIHDSAAEICNHTRFSSAKKSYATRRVPLEMMESLIASDVAPKSGDIVLARVDELGQHKGIELENGRKARLFPGDEIILAYGNRYAPDQYEAFVPDSLMPCHMVASGGIAAKSYCKHAKMSAPTRITPLALIGNSRQEVLNLAEFALPSFDAQLKSAPYVLGIVGTSMNSGKTESATQVIRGLTRAGFRVAAAKVTGTGSGGDLWSMRDAGASIVLDFSDVGLSTTYLAPSDRVEQAFGSLIGHCRASNVDVIVFEVADGIFQQETAALLSSEIFRANVNGLIFAALDSLGAVAGVQWLISKELPVLGVSGVLTSSPLSMREATVETQLPILQTDSLGTPEIAQVLQLPIGKCRIELAAVA